MPRLSFIYPFFRACRPDFCVRDAAAAVATGLLLSASFAPLQWVWAAWLALVPLGWAVVRAEIRSAVQLSILAGVIHGLTALWWLGMVTVTGMIALVLYCSLYLLPPLLLLRAWARGPGWDTAGNVAGGAVTFGLCWTVSEWARGSLLTGFPWNLLGVSQVDWTAFIGVADLGGVYLLSAIVATGNGLWLALWLAPRARLVAPSAAGFALLLAATLGYGTSREGDADTPPLRVGLVQPNTPQKVIWDPQIIDRIYLALERHTLALAREEIDLVVWPESSVPVYVLLDRPGLAFVRAMAEGSPLLVGSLHAEQEAADADVHYYNSTFLFLPDGSLAGRYDKQHLVPVGEFIPFEKQLLHVLQTFAPIQGNLTPGRQTVIMELDGIPCAPLICYEDVFPYLSRRAVAGGARWLVVQTNDGWYDGSPGARQHFRNARLRCVEHRIPMVRAAHSGVTALVGADGAVRDILLSPAGRPYPVEGHLLVEVHPGNGGLTVYARGGHMFPWVAASVVLAVAVWLRLRPTA